MNESGGEMLRQSVRQGTLADRADGNAFLVWNFPGGGRVPAAGSGQSQYHLFFADDLGYGDLGSYNANSGVPKVLLGKYLPDVFEDAAIEFIELALLAGCCPAKRERSVLKWSPGSGEAPRIAVEVKWLLS